MKKSDKKASAGMDQEQYEEFLRQAMDTKPGLDKVLEALNSYSRPDTRWGSLDQRLASYTYEAVTAHDPPADRNEMLDIFGKLNQNRDKLSAKANNLPPQSGISAERSMMMVATIKGKWNWVGALIETFPGSSIPALMEYSTYFTNWLEEPDTLDRQKGMVWNYCLGKVRKIKPRNSANQTFIGSVNEANQIRNIQKIISAYPEAVEQATPQDRAHLLALFEHLENNATTSSFYKKYSSSATAIVLSTVRQEQLSKISKKARRDVKRQAPDKTQLAKPKPKM